MEGEGGRRLYAPSLQRDFGHLPVRFWGAIIFLSLLTVLLGMHFAQARKKCCPEQFTLR